MIHIYFSGWLLLVPIGLMILTMVGMVLCMRRMGVGCMMGMPQLTHSPTEIEELKNQISEMRQEIGRLRGGKEA